MDIRIDDLRSPEIAALLEGHLGEMRQLSPPESVHALDLDALRAPAITFWTAWDGAALLGCGALKELTAEHGEIKSMHTARARRGMGAASEIVEVILNEAEERNYHRLSLETGSTEPFAPARALYTKYGFVESGPFADYREHPYSTFMTLKL